MNLQDIQNQYLRGDITKDEAKGLIQSYKKEKWSARSNIVVNTVLDNWDQILSVGGGFGTTQGLGVGDMPTPPDQVHTPTIINPPTTSDTDPVSFKRLPDTQTIEDFKQKYLIARTPTVKGSVLAEIIEYYDGLGYTLDDAEVEAGRHQGAWNEQSRLQQGTGVESAVDLPGESAAQNMWNVLRRENEKYASGFTGPDTPADAASYAPEALQKNIRLIFDGEQGTQWMPGTSDWEREQVADGWTNLMVTGGFDDFLDRRDEKLDPSRFTRPEDYGAYISNQGGPDMGQWFGAGQTSPFADNLGWTGTGGRRPLTGAGRTMESMWGATPEGREALYSQGLGSRLGANPYTYGMMQQQFPTLEAQWQVDQFLQPYVSNLEAVQGARGEGAFGIGAPVPGAQPVAPEIGYQFGAGAPLTFADFLRGTGTDYGYQSQRAGERGEMVDRGASILPEVLGRYGTAPSSYDATAGTPAAQGLYEWAPRLNQLMGLYDIPQQTLTPSQRTIMTALNDPTFSTGILQEAALANANPALRQWTASRLGQDLSDMQFAAAATNQPLFQRFLGSGYGSSLLG